MEVNKIILSLIGIIGGGITDISASDKPIIKDGKPKVSESSFYAARDTWDEIIDCMRSIKTKEFSYIRNYITEGGWDRHQHYLDFHRPALHIMRTLKKEGKLSKEELYDLTVDPYELNNLADKPEYAEVKEEMANRMTDWQNKHTDMGLLDLKEREVNFTEKDDLRIWLQKNKPEAWERIKEGEIIEDYKKWKVQSGGIKARKQKRK